MWKTAQPESGLIGPLEKIELVVWIRLDYAVQS